LWSVALEGAFAAIIVSFFFVALGLLHPVLTLPLIGIVISGALARVSLLRPRENPPRQATGSPTPANGSQ
jgi:hypothetical protein